MYINIPASKTYKKKLEMFTGNTIYNKKNVLIYTELWQFTEK